MKKCFALLLAALMLLTCTACGEKETYDFTIGICNYVDDASLNQIVENIQSRLAELTKADGLKINVLYDNCNADSNVLSQIVSNFISKKVDLMVGVATPVAMNMQAATETNKIPVVFAAVSTPVDCGLVESMEKPGANVTGTSDYLDTNAIMNLIFALKLEAKKIGLLYDIGQDSSTVAVEQAKAFLAARGVEVVEHTGTNVDEIILAADAMIADQVDAVFTPSDNTVMNAQLSIYEKLTAAGIPQFTGADSFALNGAFLGYGVDYANLGRETADMIYDILVNKKDPASVPVKTFDNGTATVNTETCAALGLKFDEVSEKFKPFCTKVASITTAESFGAN